LTLPEKNHLGIISIAALCCDIIYSLNDYSKKAAIYYKAFLLLSATSSAITTKEKRGTK
jgi:hypothetical protein